MPDRPNIVLITTDQQRGDCIGTDPLDREAERVLSDVAERYVSREQAQEVYGVVIIGSRELDDVAVDAKSTEILRLSRRPAAGA